LLIFWNLTCASKIFAGIESKKKHKLDNWNWNPNSHRFHSVSNRVGLLLQIHHFLRFHSVTKLNLALTNPTNNTAPLFIPQIKEKQTTIQQ
jgi:hypothetical protein